MSNQQLNIEIEYRHHHSEIDYEKKANREYVSTETDHEKKNKRDLKSRETKIGPET